MLHHFLLGLLVSFLGALPLGVLNLTAADIALKKGMSAVWWFALGVLLVEYIQAFIALQFSSFLIQNPQVEQYIQWAVIPLFLILGIGYLSAAWRKNKTPSKKTRGEKLSPFPKGVLLSAANPLAIPFWLGMATYLEQQQLLVFKTVYIHTFILGIIVGTLGALLLFGCLGNHFLKRFPKINQRISLLIGLIFIGMAVIQLLKL